MIRWLKNRYNAVPLIVLYKRELAVCRAAAALTGWIVFLSLLVEAPAINVVPWAAIFGASLRGIFTLPLLIETQRQFEEATGIRG